MIEQEYEITALVLVSMKVHHRVMAVSEHEAEQKFKQLVDDGFEFVYEYDLNSFLARDVLTFSDTFLVHDIDWK